MGRLERVLFNYVSLPPLERYVIFMKPAFYGTSPPHPIEDLNEAPSGSSKAVEGDLLTPVPHNPGRNPTPLLQHTLPELTCSSKLVPKMLEIKTEFSSNNSLLLTRLIEGGGCDQQREGAKPLLPLHPFPHPKT